MSFTAKYRGRCVCEDPIEIGEDCDYDADDQVVHTRCLLLSQVASASPAEVRATMCPDCFTIHGAQQKECW